MNWMKRIKRVITCLILSASMIIGIVPVWVWADDEIVLETETVYISDIRIATDSDSSSAGSARARKKLTDAGYTLLDYDLNKGTGEGWSYIGYKTTTDPEEAITDLRVMDMEGGYVLQDKEAVLEDYRTQESLANRALLTAAAEFADNYAKGSPRAIQAKKVLDYIYFPEHDDMPFGEYLVSGNYQNETELASRRAEWSDILLKTSGELTTIIYVELIQGCVDYDPDYISGSDVSQTDESGTAELASYTIISSPDSSVSEGTFMTADEVVNSLTDDTEIIIDDDNSESEPGDGFEDFAEEEIEDIIEDNKNTEDGAPSDDAEKDRSDETEEEIELEEDSSVDPDADEDEDKDKDPEEEDVDDELSDTGDADLGYTWLYRFSQQDSGSLSEKTLNATAASLLNAVQDEADVYQDAIATAESERTDEQKIIVAAHDAMNRFRYTVNTTDPASTLPIGDYLYRDDLTTEMLYPLAASLTDGQAALVQIFGLRYFALNLDNTADSYADDAAALEADMAEVDGKISLWYGYNEEMFSDNVALTSDVLRQQAATNYSPEEYKNIYLYGRELGNSGKGIDRMLDMNKYAGLVLGVISGVFGLIGVFEVLATGTAASVLAFFGFASTVITYTNLLLTACLIAAIIVVKLVELWSYYHPTYTDMPDVIYDITQTGAVSGTRAYLRYALVTDPDENHVDLNVYAGKKWNALYYTKDENAGKPITADMIVQYGSGTNGNGYSPLCLFGKEKAWNLNTDAYKDNVKGIYVFFGRDGEEIHSSDLKYVSALKVFSGSDERSVLNTLAASGYSCINQNLTPDLTSTYTYLGYMTTSDPDYAVTDIRAGISGAYGESSTKLGDMGYTDAGIVRTENFQSVHILYTVSVPTDGGKSTVSYAGSPILSGDENFYVKYSLGDEVPDGVEPVNLLSGGPAFNLCYPNAGTLVYSAAGIANHKHPETYLYFTPETQYKSTDPDATAYLGGLIFVASRRSVKGGYSAMLEAFLRSYGYELLNDSISESMMTAQSAIGYSITYNPHRAISGITTYASGNSTEVMNGATSRTTIINRKVNKRTGKTTDTYASINYTVVPVLEYSTNLSITGDGLSTYETIGYQKANSSNTYINSKYGDSYYLGRSAALYVTAGNSGLSPIKMSEWIVTDTLNPDGINAESGYRPVSALLDLSGTATDLRKGGRRSKSMYMYYQGYEDQAETYISAVKLAGASMTDDYIDAMYASKSKSERNALKSLAGDESKDTAVQNLVSEGAETYIGTFSQSNSHSQYRYLAIGAARTDTASKAITDVKLVYVSSGSPPASISRVLAYEGDKAVTALYSLVSGIPIYGSITKDASNPFKNGAYYMYTSTSSLCGDKITDLSVISNAALDGTELTEAFRLDDNRTLASGSSAYSAEIFETYRKNANQKAYDKISKYITIQRQKTDGTTARLPYVTNLSAYVGWFKPNDSDRNELAHETSYLIGTDMNKDAGGRYIYLGYQRSAQPDAAITDIYAVRSSKSSNKKSIQRWIPGHYVWSSSKKAMTWVDGKYVTYYLACGGLDFNKGAGGDYIYLYYTRDIEVASPITDILVVTGKNNYNKYPTYDYVMRDKDTAADMNKGAGGDYIYILMLHEKGDTVNRSLMAGSMLMEGSGRNIVLFVGAIVGIWGVSVLLKRKKKKTVQKQSKPKQEG